MIFATEAFAIRRYVGEISNAHAVDFAALKRRSLGDLADFFCCRQIGVAAPFGLRRSNGRRVFRPRTNIATFAEVRVPRYPAGAATAALDIGARESLTGGARALIRDPGRDPAAGAAFVRTGSAAGLRHEGRRGTF